MRSVFVENLEFEKDEFITLKVKEYHHLINVIRIKKNEEVLFFDKKSNVFHVLTADKSKKEVVFKVLGRKSAEPGSMRLSLAVGKLKKDALDLSIKQLVEIGCHEIIIFQSSFSQCYELKSERVHKVIISAMEQSNNFIFPEIIELPLEELLKTKKNLIYFTSRPVEERLDHQKIDAFKDNSLLIIGPEGGLSEREESLILEKTKNVFHLPTPILRAQTAVSFCMGYFLGKLESNR
jgi:16S rRNA (uracil1498-N3)-methyltransferase